MPYTETESEAKPFDDGKRSSSRNDDDLCREIRDKFKSYAQFWKGNFEEGDKDMDCLASEFGPWPQKDVQARKAADRIIAHIDIISQFNHRIINQAKLNPRGITVLPKGADANDETATLREDRIRQMDYESNAEAIRLGALTDAVNRGIGTYWVTTDYVRPDEFDQRILTVPTLNPKAVLWDPYCKELDYSDMAGAFKLERYEYGAYRAKYPDAKVRSFQSEYLRIADQWLDENSIQVAEYWKRKMVATTLVLIQTPEGPMKFRLDELDGAKIDKKAKVLIWDGHPYKILKQRQTQIPKVCQYITNGLEILKRNEEWTGSTIPLVIVTGTRQYVKNKLVIESLTRKLREPQLAYDYAETCEREAMGLVPKPHWQAAVGQTEEFPEYDDANRETTAVLRHRIKTEESGDNILNAPNFVQHTPDIQAFEMAKQSALQAAQQAAGMFSIEKKDRTKQSGKAIQQLNQEQDLGNYHFADYLDMAVQREGRIKNEILRHIEDTEAMRGFRGADDEYEQKKVVPMADPETGEVTDHPYGKGRDHDVVVKAGPSTTTLWEKASDFLDQLAQNPQMAPLVMDLVVSMKQLGPRGKKLEERLKRLLPPAAQDPKDGETPIPPEVQQQMQQMKQLVQALTQQLNDAKEQLRTKQNEIDAKVHMNRVDNTVKLAVAEEQTQAKVDANTLAAFMQKMDHALQLLMQDRDAQITSAQADQGHQQALEQGDQANQNALSQQQQAAELQPPPQATT